MDFITALGFAAGTITTIAFFPQVIKTWRSKSTKDISIRMFIVLCTGLFLWIIYGIYVNSLPVVASNGVTFACATIILALKAKYK
jgi:MtN3 and saliva related transmembrane protein